MRFAFIEEQRTQHCVRRMCHLLEVSRAGYYEWRSRLPSTRALADDELRDRVLQAHAKSRKTYGRPRIHAELKEQGVRIGAKRVARLMKSSGITGLSRRRSCKTTDSKHSLPIAANVLDRAFDVAERDRVWVGDITYIPTREGWLYLAVVVDLGSRRVIGWSMKETMQRDLVIDALQAALRDRRPVFGTAMFHSDRGVQYASTEFRAVLDDSGIVQSMSRKGNCWDNAVAESFFASLKGELGDPIFESRRAARAAIFDYIEIWYNRLRRHSAIGYLSPAQYESRLPIAA